MCTLRKHLLRGYYAPVTVADLRDPVVSETDRCLCPQEVTVNGNLVMSWMTFLISWADRKTTSSSKTDELALLLSLEASTKMLNKYILGPCSKEPFQKNFINKCLHISEVSLKITIAF